MSASAFRRLRLWEFDTLLPTRIPAQFVSPARPARGLASAALLLFTFLPAAAVRGHTLQWQQPYTALTVALWLLWGLAGYLPMVTALLAWLTWGQGAAPGLHARPLARLLPLTEAQEISAKIQGRLGALLLVAAGGALLGWGVRAALGALAVTAAPPPVWDPWLPGSFVLFAAGALACRQAERLQRRGHETLSLLVWGVLWFTMMVLVVGPGRFLRGDQWDAVLFPGYLLAAAAILTLVLRGVEVRGGRPQALPEARPASGAAAQSAWQRLVGGLSPLAAVSAAQRGRSHLGPLTRSVAGLTAVVTTLGLVVQGLVALGYVVASSLAAGGWHAPDPEALVVIAAAGAGPLYVAAIGMILAPLAAWREYFGSDLPRGQLQRQQPLQLTHVMSLLPITPRAFWRYRFVWLLHTEALIACGGLAGYVVTRALSGVLGAGVGEVLPAALLPAAVGMLAAGCAGFALLPLMRRALPVIRQMPWPWLLPAGIGGLLSVLSGGAAMQQPAGVLGVAAPAAASLLLWWSWAASGPGAWPLRADGSFAAGARLHALAAVIAMPGTLLVCLGLLIAPVTRLS